MIIGDSGYEVKQTFCYSGNTSNHCLYSVFPAGDEPEWYKTVHGMRPRYLNEIANFSWRSSKWSRGRRYVTINGMDGYKYTVGVRENKSLYFTKGESVCTGVVCDPVCIDADKYTQVCVTEGADAGKCTFDELIKANSPDCPGYVPPAPAEGKIVSIDVPASASEGDSIDLCASIKNIGGTKAMFFLRFYDGSSMVRETLPRWVDPGQTIENICELFTMPDHAWSGKIELFRMEE